MAQMRTYGHTRIQLTTMASKTVLKGATKLDGSREQGFFLKKIRASCGISEMPPDLGPLVIGLCNIDLSTVEVEECLTADPQKELDTPASEQVMREVMPIWYYPVQNVADADANSIRTLQTVNYPWKENIEGNGLAWFVYNAGDSALTGSAEASLFGFFFGEWLND